MSNETDKGPQVASDSSLELDRKAAHAQSRRRLIKLGSAAVPVIATLTSRPALAWHCNSASAWGSADMGTTQSQRTRNTSKRLTNETWTIANWKANTTRAGLGNPWAVLLARYPGIIGSQRTFNFTNVSFNRLSVGVGVLSPITGLTFAANYGKVAATLVANSTDFMSHVLVAQLNFLLLGNTGWDVCLKTATESNTAIPLTLQQMSNGGFSYPSNTPWNQAKVVRYLEANYIAVGV